jgi:hypothetical protein
MQPPSRAGRSFPVLCVLCYKSPGNEPDLFEEQ